MSKRLVLAGVGTIALLAGMVVPSAAYAANAAAQQTLAVQPGSLFVSNTVPANITAPVNGSGSGSLPLARWGDTTGFGFGWQGSVAATNFVYTGNWTPLNSAPALSTNASSSYTGTADGDTYTVQVTGVSGSTIDFSYTSTNGASGTGSGTTGTATAVGTHGLTITFASSSTYSSGNSYQIQVGTQNPSALILNNSSSSAAISPYNGATSTPPTFVNTAATLTGGGTSYGSAVAILSAAQNTGMGIYSVAPAAVVNADINSWAATYTSNIQYTISSGPASNNNTPSSGTTANAQLISSQTLTYSGALQTVTVPSGTAYAVVTVAGAGGAGGSNDYNTYGGAGALVKALVPVTSGPLTVLVGGGGQPSGAGSGGGGGLSGVFTGTPSQSSALVIAGGGGGGANDALDTPQSNGTSGGFTPALPASPMYGATGGPGYGGGGEGGDNHTSGTESPSGTPFGAIAVPSCGIAGQGGYGGGADGGCGWGGGGGGSGYVGGQGGSSWSGTGTPDGSGGQGGTSYVASSGTVLNATTGGGGAGGSASSGSNGIVIIEFFS